MHHQRGQRQRLACLAPGAGARLKSTKRGWNATNECCCTVPTPGFSNLDACQAGAEADHACWSFAFAISLHAARLGGHYGHAEVACLFYSIQVRPAPLLLARQTIVQKQAERGRE